MPDSKTETNIEGANARLFLGEDDTLGILVQRFCINQITPIHRPFPYEAPDFEVVGRTITTGQFYNLVCPTVLWRRWYHAVPGTLPFRLEIQFDNGTRLQLTGVATLTQTTTTAEAADMTAVKHCVADLAGAAPINMPVWTKYEPPPNLVETEAALVVAASPRSLQLHRGGR